MTQQQETMVNKTALVKEAAKANNTTQVLAAGVISSFIEGIEAGLRSVGKVKIAGLGTFEAVEREARTARNPQTGEAVEVPAKTVVKFKIESGKKVLSVAS